MMGLLAAMLARRARPRAPAHELAHGIQRTKPRGRKDAESAAAGVPGPPPVPQWNSSSAPLPDLSLVDAGMRPITGGRRRSF